MYTIGFEQMREAFIDEAQKIGKKNIERAQKEGQAFYTGEVCVTDGVQSLGYTENSHELNELYSRYIKCDWGEGECDAAINTKTIETGYGDIMGIYRLNGQVIWIITDLNEYTTTTILLPEER